MKENNKVYELSLLGGPLHRLGRRLGLVRDETNSVWLGIAIALLMWGVLALLTLLMGGGHKVFSISVIAVHVRILVAIPLFFICETWVVPRMTEFSRDIARTGLVPEAGLPDLEAEIRLISRLNNSWLAEVIFLLAAFVLPLIETFFDVTGKTGDWTVLIADTGGKFGPVLGWYFGFCLPFFRFLLFRWFWRLGLWIYFLWRVEKLKLQLVPTHPDGVAGLGYLEVVQEHFSPLVAAICSVYSAGFAEEIASGTMAFEAVYRYIPPVLLLVAALFMGPLFIFSRKLWQCRLTGLSEYMGMASRYVKAFDRRWIRDEKATGESQLGTPDLQSLADLTNSVSVVRNMRIIPAGKRLVFQLAAAVILPFLPLFLLKYPLNHLAMQLFKTLTGL